VEKVVFQVPTVQIRDIVPELLVAFGYANNAIFGWSRHLDRKTTSESINSYPLTKWQE
jgi:hypothetical protein